MELDKGTTRALVEHLQDCHRQCPACEGEKLLLGYPVEATLLATPLTDPPSRIGKARAYFPLSCRSCGLTAQS